MLRNETSSRVTWAGVFVPIDKSQPVQYVLPKDSWLPTGFVHYNPDIHHKSKKLGQLCCGNCHDFEKTPEELKKIEISHRIETAKRIAGGKIVGRPATFCAKPNTIEEHTEYCRSRRILDEDDGLLKQGVTFNINLPETYSPGTILKRAVANTNFHVEHDNPELDDRISVPINHDIAEILKKGSRFSRNEVQEARYVIDGKDYTHSEFFIDGDGWKDLVREMFRMRLATRKRIVQPHRLFHVVNPASRNLTEFNAIAKGEEEDRKIKISLRQYEFRDKYDQLHIIQPSIETTKTSVKKLFENMGDYLVMGKFKYMQTKSDGGRVTIHQIGIIADSANLTVELYNTPKRKIRDLETMMSLQRDFDKLSIIDPKLRAKPKAKPSTITAFPVAQMDLFGSPAP